MKATGIVRRIDDRHSRDQQLNFLGNCDPLTGMMNRGRMAEALEDAIASADREGVPRATGFCALTTNVYSFSTVEDLNNPNPSLKRKIMISSTVIPVTALLILSKLSTNFSNTLFIVQFSKVNLLDSNISYFRNYILTFRG